MQRELEWLILVHGRPDRIISDNGLEFRALSMPATVTRAFIEPVKPSQNSKIESFTDKLRDEVLNRELFHSGTEMQASLDDYCEFYNHDRPHCGLNGKTPI